jgi:effector-binding domain-containing protein
MRACEPTGTISSSTSTPKGRKSRWTSTSASKSRAPFEGEGEVVFTQTPAGQVASTLHIGPYDTLSDAHDAIDAWRATHGRALAGASWEIYGDWNDDPEKLEVRVLYLLA